MKKVFVIFAAFLMSGMTLFAQGEQLPPTKGISVGLHYTTRGLGTSIDYHTGQDYRQWVYSLDIFQVKDMREAYIDPFIQEQGSKYIYGKTNHFLVLAPSLGLQWDLFPIGSSNFVKVIWGFKGGPALGLLNPYYLEILKPVSGTPFNYVVDVEEYSPANHTYSDIFARASLLSSQVSLSVRLGASLKTYAILDFASNERTVGGLMIGAHADIFTSPVPIMAETNEISNRQAFFSLSLGLLFGHDW